MWHKPYIYMLIFGILGMFSNWYIIKQSIKNELDHTFAFMGFVYWCPLGILLGIAGLICKW